MRKDKKTGTRHIDKTVERKGGTGEGRQPPRSPHTQENANVQKTLTKTPTSPLQRSMDQEHKESCAHAYITNADHSGKTCAPSFKLH